MKPLTSAEQSEMDAAVASVAPMDNGAATRLLLEMKQVLDKAGIRFFLRQGTCHGAIRDGALIAWDDDVDIGSFLAWAFHAWHPGTRSGGPFSRPVDRP